MIVVLNTPIYQSMHQLTLGNTFSTHGRDGVKKDVDIIITFETTGLKLAGVNARLKLLL